MAYTGSMQTKWLIVTFLVLAVVIGAWVALVYLPHTSQVPQPVVQRIPPVDTHYTAPPALIVHHTVVNGANVYAGTLPIRSCNTIATGLSSSGSAPVELTISFKVFDGDGTCLTATSAESDQQPFSVSFSSKVSTRSPVVTALTINGSSVPFKVVEGE